MKLSLYRPRLASLALAIGLLGCARSARQTIYLQPGRPIDLKGLDMRKQSLVIALKAGEVLPLEINIEGYFVASQPGASVPLTVKHDCFVRVDDRGLRVSADGHDFDRKAQKPGSFRIGLEVDQQGKHVSMRVVTPTPRGGASGPASPGS